MTAGLPVGLLPLVFRTIFARTTPSYQSSHIARFAKNGRRSRRSPRRPASTCLPHSRQCVLASLDAFWLAGKTIWPAVTVKRFVNDGAAGIEKETPPPFSVSPNLKLPRSVEDHRLVFTSPDDLGLGVAGVPDEGWVVIVRREDQFAVARCRRCRCPAAATPSSSRPSAAGIASQASCGNWRR